MVLSTLVYIALIIIVIIIIVVLLRFLFNVLLILPVTLGHDYQIKLVYAQSEQYTENQSVATEGFPLVNTTNASSPVDGAKNMSVIDGMMNQTQ